MWIYDQKFERNSLGADRYNGMRLSCNLNSMPDGLLNKQLIVDIGKFLFSTENKDEDS